MTEAKKQFSTLVAIPTLDVSQSLGFLSDEATEVTQNLVPFKKAPASFTNSKRSCKSTELKTDDDDDEIITTQRIEVVKTSTEIQAEGEDYI